MRIIDSNALKTTLRKTAAASLGLALAALLLTACGGSDPAQPSKTGTANAEATKARALAAHPDHYEFEASLDVPFTSSAANGARTFTVHFNYLGAPAGQVFVYRLELLPANGNKVIEQWQGEARYEGQSVSLTVPWAGRVGAAANLPDGLYRVQLHASSVDPEQARNIAGSGRVAKLLEAGEHAHHEQSWEMVLGKAPQAVMPAFTPMRVGGPDEEGRARALAAPATGGLPYTVYYGNLHSQSNDSDGGGALATCTSSQPAQSGAFGPADAFSYAKTAGLDILVSSEHNHYFDGSSGTNTSGSATAAKARYQAGLSAASSFNGSNPGFLAVYGMEWGVISGGGHMNIFNSNELFAWEYNSSNQLFGDRFTAKSDYAALYATMRTQGLVGQFNHPDSTGQFKIGTTDLAYNADGDEVMVLAEILTTSAFSSNTTETETSRTSYESTFKKILERGFHVAPSTNQDNHCANWGKSYTNRTGVLIPTGTTLTTTAFVNALKARRVFATMDKNSQIVLQANGRVMGERFTNTGTLNLSVGFANSAGRTATTVQILRGVPGRNGTVTVLASSGSASLTPTVGQHFFYAKVTQDDGKSLWSAPIWVTQNP